MAALALLLAAALLAGSAPAEAQFVAQSHLGRLVQSIASPFVFAADSAAAAAGDEQADEGPSGGAGAPPYSPSARPEPEEPQADLWAHNSAPQTRSPYPARPSRVDDQQQLQLQQQQQQHHHQQQQQQYQEQQQQPQQQQQQYYQQYQQQDPEEPQSAAPDQERRYAAPSQARRRSRPAQLDQQYQMGAYLGPAAGDDRELAAAFGPEPAGQADLDEGPEGGRPGPEAESRPLAPRPSYQQATTSSARDFEAAEPEQEPQRTSSPPNWPRQRHTSGSQGSTKGGGGGGGVKRARQHRHRQDNDPVAAANGYAPYGYGPGPMDLANLMGAMGPGGYQAYQGDGSAPFNGYYGGGGGGGGRRKAAASNMGPFGPGGYNNNNNGGANDNSFNDNDGDDDGDED